MNYLKYKSYKKLYKQIAGMKMMNLIDKFNFVSILIDWGKAGPKIVFYTNDEMGILKENNILTAYCRNDEKKLQKLGINEPIHSIDEKYDVSRDKLGESGSLFQIKIDKDEANPVQKGIENLQLQFDNMPSFIKKKLINNQVLVKCAITGKVGDLIDKQRIENPISIILDSGYIIEIQWEVLTLEKELEYMIESLYDINLDNNEIFLKNLRENIGSRDELTLFNCIFLKLGKSASFIISQPYLREDGGIDISNSKVSPLSKTDNETYDGLDKMRELLQSLKEDDDYLIITNLKGKKGLWNNLEVSEITLTNLLKLDEEVKETILKELKDDKNKASEGGDLLNMFLDIRKYLWLRDQLTDRIIFINDDEYPNWRSKYEDAFLELDDEEES